MRELCEGVSGRGGTMGRSMVAGGNGRGEQEIGTLNGREDE